ncbi:long-chain fatty acid--CoA ligase [Pseudokordiimonas caeni]|uniref:long-chain fatty acid--CoA ligase n=1 Tax=Pseudokordiimonas caeni TaxID=2997908 RepID=UPI0028116E0C|nr:long-chain fatty acid--CoA ligase [Pseudokordiimonas caeni]
MLGLMQNWPLLVSKILTHAEINHPKREVISMQPEGGQVRMTWGDVARRSRQCAEALAKLGVKQGDRVATLAWNTNRHVEAWYASSGMGAVNHTINPRLFPEQIVYIANHAEDKVLMFDITFLPLVEKLAPMMKSIEHYIIMVGPEHMPQTSLPNVHSYEALLAAEPGTFEWPELDENTACGLCYTSGTTGHPKGVLYSHRSNFLHTLVCLSTDTLKISAVSTVLPVVPMFHANAWAIPYATAAAGSKLVLNGPHHDPETLHKLIKDEGITVTAAVPTIWNGMLAYIKANNLDMKPLELVTIGGSAVPRSMIETFQKDYGVRVNHAWGMTEMSPLGSVGSENGAIMDLSAEEKLDYQVRQGRPPIGVELCIKDDDGNMLPRDGKTAGRLMARGPWVIDSYYRADETALDDGGWFDTGDVAALDPASYIQITDRSKDVIKSGGEWISSIDLENEAVAHPDVTEAAVIGVRHPKWEERPLMIITVKEGKTVSRDNMLEFLDSRCAKWWLPDDVVTVDSIPHTATGKISKKDLREQFKDYQLPTA